MDYALAIADDFMQFVAGSEHEFDSLSHYASCWIEDGEAIRLTAGDFGLFMLIFALATDTWMKNPTEFGKNGSRIRKIVEFDPPQSKDLPLCLDRDEWKREVFEYRQRSPHGRSKIIGLG